MAYTDAEEDGGPRTSNITRYVIGIAVAAALSFGYRYYTTGSGLPGRGGWTAERVDTELQRAGPQYRALKTHYPADYDALVQRLLPAARAGNEAVIAQESFNSAQRFIASHIEDLAKAPSPELQAIARQYATLADALRRSDVALCARFATTGFRPSDRPDAEVRTLAAEISAAQIAASRSGQGQQRASRGSASEADTNRFADRLRASSPDAIRVLQRINSATPAEQCSAGVAVHRAMAEGTADESAAMIVDFFRSSFQGSASAPAAPGG